MRTAPSSRPRGTNRLLDLVTALAIASGRQVVLLSLDVGSYREAAIKRRYGPGAWSSRDQ